MIRDKKHLEFIRSLICVKCGTSQNIQAAHIRANSDGGIGIKPSDDRCLPMCHDCHSKQHRVGEVTFWGGVDDVFKAIELAKSIYGKDLFEAKKLLMEVRCELI